MNEMRVGAYELAEKLGVSVGKACRILENAGWEHRYTDEEVATGEIVYFRSVNYEYERAPDDGRCVACEGWGCAVCAWSGGY